ncbi:hypothetical protein [Streptomyces sp. NPDC086023]|uniref:hypothetical protein n=1 Tax=Streptomyces sp. NPDC086023 TaxID=3365746 RepID=UPI0037CD36F5
MSTSWQNENYGDLFKHLKAIRRSWGRPGTRSVGRGCANCRGFRRTILVDGELRVVYSEPCLACRGNGTTERAGTSA